MGSQKKGDGEKFYVEGNGGFLSKEHNDNFYESIGEFI
jgi:hypothetical protein